MTLIDSVRGLLCENYGVRPEAVTNDTMLAAIKSDGFDVLDIIIGVQIEFGIDIDEDDIDTLGTVGTVGDLVAVIEAKSKAGKVV